MKQGQKRIASLEVGRGVAAFMVVLHHANALLAQPRYYGEELAALFEYFYVGVDFFFVLSGFIICWVHWGDIGDRRTLESYATKRFLRIYPPYWAILLPLIALYFAFPNSGLDTQRDPLNIAASVLLLPYPMPPVLGVAWTLVYEIFFYAVFALIIALGRRGLWLFPLWAAAVIAGSFWTEARDQSHLAAFVLSPFNIEFILGVGVAILLRNRSIPFPGLLAAAGVAAFAGFLLLSTPIFDGLLSQRLAFGLSAACFIAGMVELEWKQPLRLPTALSLFGAASYATYLIHPVILSFSTIGIFRVFGPSLPLWTTLIAISGLAALAGLLFHLLIEKRVTHAARFILSAMGLSAARSTPPRRA